MFLTNQKLEINMPQNFKTKCIVNFRKYRSRKKKRFGGVKLRKSNKIEKTEELIAGYQEAECLWNILSLEYIISFVQRQKLMANGLTKSNQNV